MAHHEQETVIFDVVVLIIGGISRPTFQVQRAEASGTICIRANGLVEGTDKIITADNVTHTFTDNVNDSIVVDGAGYTLQGTGSGKGIDLYARILPLGFKYSANQNRVGEED